MVIGTTVLNKVVKVGFIEKVPFEQRLEEVWGVGNADKE